MRPRRPVGLTIALLACAVLYGIYPLLEAGLFLSVNIRTGSNITAEMILTLVTGIIFTLLVILAWRGRPPAIRAVLIGAVVIVALINLAFLFGNAAAQASSLELDAGQQIAETLRPGTLLAQILIPLYVIWYLNRAPARAYYAAKPAEETGR